MYLAADIVLHDPYTVHALKQSVVLMQCCSHTFYSLSIPTYFEVVESSGESEDERAVDEQEEFERKYNFRFEEPDSEFVSYM